MDRRPLTPFGDEEPHEAPRLGNTSREYRSDKDVRSLRSRTSFRRSVDSVLIEHFSGSDSSSNSSLREPQSSASNLSSTGNQGPARGWMSRLERGVRRSATKRKARKLVDELIQATNTKDDQATARHRRYEAATRLVRIIKNKPNGEEIVARRFVKSAWRQDRGTQALLKLSDDELDLFGFGAVSPVPEPLAFTELLAVVVKHTSESQFFRRTISTALRDGEEGAAAILYLATTETRNFFLDIDCQILINFCDRVVTKEPPFCPKWYCGAQLLGILPQKISASSKTKYGHLIMKKISFICEALIQEVTTIADPNMPEEFRKDPIARGAPLLLLIAVCCETITREKARYCFPTLDAIDTFIKWLISFADYGYGIPGHFGTKSALALSTLRSLVQNHLIVAVIPDDTLSQLGTTLLNIGLNPVCFGVRGSEPFEIFIRHFKNSEKCCIHSLCFLPQSAFNDALASALNNGIIELDSPETRNSYEPFGLVERLLWLSNLKLRDDRRKRVLHALVGGGACVFLTIVLSHTGDLSPQDRGLWRAKGLAMTCLGNIIERMDEDQFLNHATEEIIDVVVAIKEHEDVPLVQKGQAIFMLQRYTLAADRWGVQPHYREDTSNMDEGFGNADADTDADTDTDTDTDDGQSI